MRYRMSSGVGLLWIGALAVPLAAYAEKRLDGTLETEHAAQGSRNGAAAFLYTSNLYTTNLYTTNNVGKGAGDPRRAPAGAVELMLVRQ